MGRVGASARAAFAMALCVSTCAFGQELSPASDRPPPGTIASSLEGLKRWFELDAPFSKQLKVTFDVRPVPTYEPLQLAAFEGRAQLWQRGNLTVSLFERVVPGTELNCRLTCLPILESSFGAESRLSVGSLGRRVPSIYAFSKFDIVRLPLALVTRSLVGFGGLLDL